MSLLARATDFLPNTIIASQPFDDEFNQLVNLLSGVSQNKSIRVISNDSAFAVARFDQRGINHVLELYADGIEVGRVEKDGDLVCLGLNGVAGVYTFSNIPVGPASNPTLDNQLVRKRYTDDKIVPFSLAFRIDDPSTFPVNDDTVLPLIRVPAITGGFVTKLTIIRAGGSHTAGGSVTFQALKFNDVLIGSGVSFNDTNNLISTPYNEDFADVALVEGNFLTVRISARSGTVSERAVSINIEGYRKVS